MSTSFASKTFIALSVFFVLVAIFLGYALASLTRYTSGGSTHAMIGGAFLGAIPALLLAVSFFYFAKSAKLSPSNKGRWIGALFVLIAGLSAAFITLMAKNIFSLKWEGLLLFIVISALTLFFTVKQLRAQA